MCDYLLLPFVEIEIRFGTQNDKKFDASVDKKYFEKIKSELLSGDWKETKCIETIEYIKDSIKLIQNGKSTKVIMKENVLTKTFSLKNRSVTRVCWPLLVKNRNPVSKKLSN